MLKIPRYMNESKVFSLIRVLDAMPFSEMILIVMVSVIGVACVLMLVIHFFRQSNLESMRGFGYIGNDVIAGVFGLLLAFLIISMYESKKSAEESVNKEANDLVCILFASQQLDNAALIRKEVQIYTKTLLEKEWPAMSSGDLTTAWKLAPEMVNPLYKAIQKSKSIIGDKSKFKETLPLLLQDLVAVHRTRLLQADFHLPIQFWIIILLMTFFTICFLAYMNPWQGLHSFVPVLLPSLIISLSLALVVSLHFPFLGPFAVTDTPFRRGYLLNFNIGYNPVHIVPSSFNELNQPEGPKKLDSSSSTLH